MQSSRCPFCTRQPAYYYCHVNGYAYYRCPACRSLYLHPLPSRQALNDYYAHDFAYGEGAEVSIRQRARITLARLKRMYPHGKTVLDIGSGKGYFLEEAEAYGLTATGIEPSADLCAYSRQRGLSVLHTTLEQTDVNRTYDFVTIIHVIEHMLFPHQTIMKAMNMLNPHGVLYIETPNCDSWLFRAEQHRYTFLTPPDHLWLFSGKALTQLCQPFIPMRCSTYSYPEHLVGILKTVLHRNRQRQQSDISHQQSPDVQLNRKRRLLPYLFIHVLFSRLFYRLLNIGDKGSILELYLKKNPSKC